jgi:RNA polymerase sigma factor (sigma-70 family)
MTSFEFHTQLLNLEYSLQKFAYSLTLKKADAEDLLQETFLKVLLNKEKYVNHENFKAWTFTIMRNTYINIYRRESYKYTWHDLNRESFSNNQTIYIGADNPDSAYSVMEITRNIEQLKDKFRIPFKMYVNGYKYQEIADRLKVNIGTIKSRIYLSRKLLMDQLNG